MDANNLADSSIEDEPIRRAKIEENETKFQVDKTVPLSEGIHQDDKRQSESEADLRDCMFVKILFLTL